MSPSGLRENPEPPKAVRFAAAIVLIAALSILGLVYCTGAASRQNPTPSPAPAPTTEQSMAVPIDAGNGVYYFPVANDAYIAALVKFYENGNGDKHCDLQGTTERVAGYSTVTTGFILHCHDIAVDAQELTKE